MKKYKKSVLLILILTCYSYAQKEDWLWYSTSYGVTFNTPDTSHKFVYDKKNNSSIVHATISDKDANLLFYCNDQFIWNKKHQLMDGGDITMNNKNHWFPIVCHKPGNKYQYYHFSIGRWRENSNAIYYSIIDLRGDSGYGSVIKKNILIDTNFNSFTVIYHANGIDLWLILYNIKLNIFKSFFISKENLNPNPIISKGNPKIDYSSNTENMTYTLERSPDGSKILTLYQIDNNKRFNFDLYFFDRETGKIIFINSVYHYLNKNLNDYEGFISSSFSSNSKYIYSLITDSIPFSNFSKVKSLYQFYLDYDSTGVKIKKNLIYADSVTNYRMSDKPFSKLTPNKKIYFNNYLDEPFFISELINADSLWPVCKLRRNIPIETKNFPMIQNYFPCYYCFYAGVKEPICEGDTIFLEGNLSSRFVEPEFYWTGPNGFTSKERSPILPNAEKRHSGLYKLYVKADTTLLFDSVFVYIFDRQKAKIKINGSQQLCKNGVIELQSEYKDKSYSYLWSNGSTKDKISVNKGGIYKLYVTNEAGCVGVDSIEIYDPAEVKLKSDKEGLCYGETAIISFETDFKNLSFVWSNKAKDSSITVSEPGIYKLYYEYGNCRDSQEIKINDYGKIGAKIIGDSVICKGDSVWLQAYPQLYNFRYLWSTGSKEHEIKESGTKNIYLIIENQYGCKDTAYLSLREIESINTKISGGIGICEGQKKKLKAITPTEENIYNYKWSTGDTTKEIIIEKEGIYHLEVTLNGKCKVYDTIRIVKAEPPKPTIIGNEYICPGSTDVLICKEEFTSYQWNTGDTTKQINIDKSGKYTLTVIDSNGCEASAFFEVKEYDVNLSGFIDWNFGKNIVGRLSMQTLQLKNESNSDLEIINIFTKKSPDVFEIKTNPTLPLTLQQSEVLDISINFKPNQAKVFNDIIIIITGKPCKDVFLSQVTGEGIKMAIGSTVWLPDTIAQIGTKNFRIPIRAKLNQDTSISNLGYSIEVRFDARYYLPESITEGVLEKNTRENNERILRIRGDNKTITGNETTLTEITGLVLLGKPEPAILKIISFDWNEPEISVAKENGRLTVTGVCNQGFSNLVISNNLILEIVGNPAKDYIEIIYNVETGLSPVSNDEINIYNILGECVLSEKIHPITMSYRMNIEHLPSGIYFVRLGDWVGSFVKIE